MEIVEFKHLLSGSQRLNQYNVVNPLINGMLWQMFIQSN